MAADNTTTIIKTNRTTFMVPSFKFMYQPTASDLRIVLNDDRVSIAEVKF